VVCDSLRPIRTGFFFINLKIINLLLKIILSLDIEKGEILCIKKLKLEEILSKWKKIY